MTGGMRPAWHLNDDPRQEKEIIMNEATPVPVTPWVPPVASWAVVYLADGTLHWLIGGAADVIARIEALHEADRIDGAVINHIASAN